MTNSIDNAIARIQAIALASTSVTIKSAPDYPIENTDPLPMAITYLGGGTFNLTNATIHHNFPEINVEFHFSRVNLKQAYQQINLIALEFAQRLAGDPTLNGTVKTVVGGRDAPIAYTVRPFAWDQVTTQMLLFAIPIKLLPSPLSTA